ncbi:Oidioi.mRNA.OKI2018_I69.chr2.g4784.t1.cds [Oikopleura dioica]|uniref:Oidioi.mRNA.OKI2018_I69.chr2.g4784.t1.cds n=1 Tax=Oikopleura dioica TaxID=34765 RepID=A0ABN7T254_OIKDI|nr:Oidioi.mRNA.OKI2018_I69.chr2.g4784.t1.cds [Oikopleura dioica]
MRIFEGLIAVATALAPKKLYTLKSDVQVDGVKVLNGHLTLFGPHYIGIIDNVKSKSMSVKRMVPRAMIDSIAYPTNIGRVPDATFPGARGKWWITSAAFNGTSGHVFFVNPKPKGTNYKGISGDDDYTYENLRFVDMDLDGKLDVITARSLSNSIGAKGELLWLKQPGGNGHWPATSLHEGMADANFELLERRNKRYFIVAGRKYSTLGIVWTVNKGDKFLKKQEVRHRVVDNYGPYNDVQIVDINNDGRFDVLTSVIKRGGGRGHVLAYQVPDDFLHGQWKRNVIAAGFDIDGSPGRAQAFWPDPKTRGNSRPHVFVSGSADGGSYILEPKGNKGFAFSKMVAAPSYGRIGLFDIADITGDGRPEIIIPQEDKIHVYTFPKVSNKKSKDFTSHNPMETVENPKLGIIPKTRYQDNSPKKSSLQNRVPMMPGAFPMMPNGMPMMPPMPPMLPNGMMPMLPNGFPMFPPGMLPPPAGLPMSPAIMPKAPMQPKKKLPTKLVEGPKVMLKSTDLTSPEQNKTSTNGPPMPYETSEEGEIMPGQNTVEERIFFDHEMFSVTSGVYDGQSLAGEECVAMGRQLCTQKQILMGLNIEDPGIKSWLLYDSRGKGPRLARMKSCNVADVLWEGYECINGVLETSAIKKAVLSNGLCCGVMAGATLTDSYFPHKQLAEKGCKQQDKQLCQADELLKIWGYSTLKSPFWGWIAEGKLAKMAKNCDPNSVLWNGYTCFAGKIEITAPTSEISSNAPAYCCDNNLKPGFKKSSGKTAIFSSLLAVITTVFLL